MKRNAKRNLAFGACFISLIVFAAYNIHSNNSFFTAPLYSILNLTAVVFVSFYLAQAKTDQRKAKESAEHLIEKIQIALLNPDAYHIDCQEAADQSLRLYRSLNNKLTVLRDHAQALGCDQNMNYISDTFKECKRLTGDHITDFEYLLKSENDIKNKLELIDDKLDEMKIQLYT